MTLVSLLAVFIYLTTNLPVSYHYFYSANFSIWGKKPEREVLTKHKLTIKVIGLKFRPYLHIVLALSTVSLKKSLGTYGHFSKNLNFAVYYGEVLLWLAVIAIKHLFCLPSGDTIY